MTSPLNVIRDDIQAMTAYHVADLPEGFIKLDAMESPYHPFAASETLLDEWKELLAQSAINLYPNPATSGLQTALRQVFGIPESAQIALGNGSDELIQFLTMLVAKPGATMLAVEPSFVMYKHNAALYGMNYVGVPLNEDFTLNLPAVLAAIEQHNPSLIFITYPNNPTGVCFRREEVEAVIRAANGIVVVDEAYGAFSHDSFLSQAGKPDNLVIMRTVSKIGFAGIRLGYACGSPVVMNELAKILPPYNMNQLSLATAKFAMKHAEVIQQTVAALKAERERVFTELSHIGGLQAFPSEANFITVRVPDAQALYDALKAEKILIKKLHGAHPLLSQCLRLTIGSPEQNDAVLSVIRKLYR
ncbi:histidinol-phosphate transaminase [Neisseria animalis]|uniref:Histidinol-phosphate aminotransferase n=1 Tax=Neisseria animalis TaxID=492 RepID=A0A5P3MS97_NEIAN|nr:histidinol-phosphate transaminase [Neisseria animalis]QEY24473.1 histidinol-phosphate transaminase [Neisseria animalis]ROW33107.1 histidinol-phosphate transaminase [Neisseria animalis]VEE07144.1 histidinol-phosphate aminotransferase [Neisseria animalis]